MLDQQIPAVLRVGSISDASDGHEMCLHVLNGLFGHELLLVIRGSQLALHSIGLNSLNECIGDFIVQF